MLDEHIGHLVLWTGYFAFWATLLRGSRCACSLKLDFSIKARTCAAAFVMGATHAVALIESSHPELCILPLLLAILALRSSTCPLLLRIFTLAFTAALAAAMASCVSPLDAVKFRNILSVIESSSDRSSNPAKWAEYLPPLGLPSASSSAA
jgi:hypothetical protein